MFRTLLIGIVAVVAVSIPAAATGEPNVTLTAVVGPRVNRKTKIAAKTTRTWLLYLQPGSYSYLSDRNKGLSGAFIVAGSPPA